jgi:ribonuclease Z
MSIRVIFLGTSGAIPTEKRGLPATLLKRGTELFLFDCGEGLQRQMIKAKIGFHKRMKVFLSHLHGDHVLGLPGLLQTMSLMDRKVKLEVYAPVGTKHFLECVAESLQYALTFPLEIHEIQDAGVACNETEYVIKAVWANHVLPTLAYAFIEKPRPGKFYPEKARAFGVPEGVLWSKLQHGEPVTLSDDRIVAPEDVSGPLRRGRKIIYTGDTQPFKGFAKFASEADLLIHEATFDDTLSEKAVEDGHSTPRQAAIQAKKAKAKTLVLTHLSARYTDTSLLLAQAKKVFNNVTVAEDFLELELPLSEQIS